MAHRMQMWPFSLLWKGWGDRESLALPRVAWWTLGTQGPHINTDHIETSFPRNPTTRQTDSQGTVGTFLTSGGFLRVWRLRVFHWTPGPPQPPFHCELQKKSACKLPIGLPGCPKEVDLHPLICHSDVRNWGNVFAPCRWHKALRGQRFVWEVVAGVQMEPGKWTRLSEILALLKCRVT